MRNYRTYLSLLALPSFLFFVRCANPVSPEGGLKDITPPGVKECTPPNNSVSFKGKTIRVEFDEFVNVETSGNKILISPPMNELPDFRVRGKALVISFTDTLRANTTYSIDFGQSVSDITENNKIPGFRFAFSTGSILDSLVLTGSVIDAFTGAPVKEVFVMLYRPDNDTLPPDSLPVRVKPFYLTRSGADGGFSFSNLAAGRYKLFALDDKTGDLLFNLQGEPIAFADSLASPWIDGAVRSDSASNDSSILIASPQPVVLRMFEPKDSVQSIEKASLVRENMISLVFRYPARNLHVVPVNLDSLSAWCLMEPGVAGDTMTLWITSPVPDTLRLKVTAEKMATDTLDLSMKLKDQQKKGKKVEEGPKRLALENNMRGGILNYFTTPLVLTASYPLKRADLTGMRLISGTDTLTPGSSFSDSLRRRITIIHKWAEGKLYQLFIPDSLLFSVNDLTNDTTRIRIRTAEARNYGNLAVTLTPQDTSQLILQLLSDNEKVLAERIVNKTGRISFEYLLPAKYKLKIIFDSNKNLRWDSGDYFRKIQPEKVIYFPTPVDIRANWDVEESWVL